MTANIALMQDMLKQQLEPKIQDQLTWKDVLLEDSLNIDWKNKVWVDIDMKNNKFEITSLISWMTWYSGAEQASLIASDIWLDKMEVIPKFLTASFVLWHAAIVATSKSQASLEQATSLYWKEIRRALIRAKWRVLRWNGTWIVWVLPEWVQTWTAITISNRAKWTVASENRYWLGALDIFDSSQKIELWTEADFAWWTQIEWVIATVDSETQITLTSSVTVWAAAWTNNRWWTNADTWHIRFKGSYWTTPMGLFGLIDDWTQEPSITSIQGKTRATTPYMKSIVYNKTNSNTIIKDFRELWVKTTKFNREMKYFLVSEDVYGTYTDAITVSVQANQSSTPYTSKLWVGHTWLMFAYGSTPIPIMLDALLPYGKVLLLDLEQLFCADLFKEDFVPDWIMTRITWTTNYETARASYFNFWTFASRKLWGLINYEA